MADYLKRKCLKCGFSPNADNPNIKLHRFPKPGSTNMRRCEMWAKYCFPDMPWSCVDFQRKLYSEHRMLCNKHFKDSEFISIEERKLCKHAVPDMIECDTDVRTMPFLQVDDIRKTAVFPSQPVKYPKSEKATGEVQHEDQHDSNNLALSDAADDAGSSEDVNIPEPPSPPPLNLHTAQMCRVCLALDVKMFDLRETKLKTMFQMTTGITLEENECSKLGTLICWECAARLKTASTFISKALFSESLLQGLIKKGEQIQKQYYETLKENADNLISPKTLTVTEIVHIVEIEDQNNMTQLVQLRDDDEPSLSENCETEEIIMYVIENSEMDVEGDNVPIETRIGDDPTCPNAEELNRTKIIKVNPLDSISSIEETINSGYSHPLQRTLLLSDSTKYEQNFEDEISKTFSIETSTKSKTKKSKQNIKPKNPIKIRSKVAVSHDHEKYLKGDRKDGNKMKKLKTYSGTNKKVPSQKVARDTQVF